MRLLPPIFLAGVLIFFAAPTFPAQTQGQTVAGTSKIDKMTVTGTERFPADQIVTASGLKPGDEVTAQQIQAAADRLAALGIFSTVNYHYTSTVDSIAIEFQVTDSSLYPLSFDNFPWFTDKELADEIRAQVGLFSPEVPGGGTMIDQITIVLERLLASQNIHGNVAHRLIPQPVENGMLVQFSVEGATPAIESVTFGDALATQSESLKDRIPDLKGQPYSRYAIEVFDYEHVRSLYASKGFLHAQVGPPVAHLAGDANSPSARGVDVTIPITPGPVYSWKGASWQGNSVFTSTILDGAFGLKSGDVADGIKIEAEWQRIEAEYTRHGYLDVKLDAQPQFDEAAHQVSYHVNIAEGPQYQMGSMVITGLSVEAEERLRHVWLLTPGQVFDNGYYETIAKELSKPNPDFFGEMPVHYTQFGHFLRANSDKHTVDVLMDFK